MCAQFFVATGLPPQLWKHPTDVFLISFGSTTVVVDCCCEVHGRVPHTNVGFFFWCGVSRRPARFRSLFCFGMAPKPSRAAVHEPPARPTLCEITRWRTPQSTTITVEPSEIEIHWLGSTHAAVAQLRRESRHDEKHGRKITPSTQ